METVGHDIEETCAACGKVSGMIDYNIKGMSFPSGNRKVVIKVDCYLKQCVSCEAVLAGDSSEHKIDQAIIDSLDK